MEQEEQEWTPLPGGTWSAWPMRKNRQPKSGDVRVFAVAVSLNTLWAGGAVKFMDVPGLVGLRTASYAASHRARLAWRPRRT